MAGTCLSVRCHLLVGDVHGHMNIMLAHYCFFLPRPGGTVCPLGSEGQLHIWWVLVLLAAGNLLLIHGWRRRAFRLCLSETWACFLSPSLSPSIFHVGDRSAFFSACPSANDIHHLYNCAALIACQAPARHWGYSSP